jgi:hypothetical protein
MVWSLGSDGWMGGWFVPAAALCPVRNWLVSSLWMHSTGPFLLPSWTVQSWMMVHRLDGQQPCPSTDPWTLCPAYPAIAVVERPAMHPHPPQRDEAAVRPKRPEASKTGSGHGSDASPAIGWVDWWAGCGSGCRAIAQTTHGRRQDGWRFDCFVLSRPGWWTASMDKDGKRHRPSPRVFLALRLPGI